MVKRFGIALIVTAVILLSQGAYADEIRFTSIDMASGLSHNSALCVIQDQQGFIWIGTRDGLNRFDGTEFQIYKRNFHDSTSISNNQVNTIYESSDNSLWIGTADGLNRYDKKSDRFTRIKLPVIPGETYPHYIWSVMETGDGTILAGTSRGLYSINQKNEEVIHYLVNSDPQDHSNAIIRILMDSQGRIWLGTRNGIYRFFENQFKRNFIDKAFEEHESRFEIRDIKEHRNGSFWVGTEAYGMAILSVRNDSLCLNSWMNNKNCKLISNTVRKIFFQMPNETWIGTLNGLSIYHTDTGKLNNYRYTPDQPGGINNYSIRDIFKDRQGGIWLATYAGGINYYHPDNNQFIRRSHLESRDGIKKIQAITSLMADKQGNLWIGTEADGLLQCDINSDRLIRTFNTINSQIVSDNIKSIVSDDDGNLWIGTFNGLSRLNIRTNVFENYTHQPGESHTLKNNQVHVLLYEEEILWIGSNGGGVQFHHLPTGRFHSVKGLENKNVNSIFKDSKNRLWIGTQSGVYLLSDKNRMLAEIDLLKSESLAHARYVNFITEDHNQNIWIGTQWNGLFLIRNKEVQWFTTENGLPDNTVHALLEGPDDQYWITTNLGLARLNYSEDEVPSVDTKSFTVVQGLQENQYYPRSSLKHPSGVLYFGGINGFNKFDPEKIRNTDKNLPVVFTQFRLNYKKITPNDAHSPLSMDINETDQIILGYDQRDFSLFFKGLDYSNPENIFYRYRVVGLDDTWVELGNQQSINFTYFPAGTYELRIQASTNAEYWEDTYRGLKIIIKPPWWKTWWAFILYAMVISSLLLLFFHFSQQWAKIKNQLEMEHFQREKEGELHQLKLKFFTDVSHELRTPLTLILAPLENLILKPDFPNRFRNQLIQIQRSGYRMMQLITQILDLRKLETGHERLWVAKGNIIRFLSELSLAFREVAISRNLSFEFRPHTGELGIWFDRDKLEIIFNNLLSNAFKFSFQNGRIQMDTRVVSPNEITGDASIKRSQGDYLAIRVINEGEAISSDDLQQIYNRFFSKSGIAGYASSNVGVGLELTKRMVGLHRGFITTDSIKNDHGIGSQVIFTVYFPIERDLFTDDEIDFGFKSSEDPSLYKNELLKSELMVTSTEDKMKTEGLPINRGREKIVVVEDNAEVRRFITELFHEQYTVYEAENGSEGFEKVIDESPELIISDIMMPVMDGIELCKKIKTDPRTCHIPVILLTARTAVTFKYEGLETGADEYITKPFSAQYLLLRVVNLINQRNLLKEHFKRKVLCDPGSITVTSIDEKLLIDAVNYITENISQSNISVSTLSEHLGLSRVHFYRKIRSLTGQTAVEFIRSIRLKRAAALLEQEKFSVKEVQYMTGFDDADYFRKCFQRQFGVNPSQYRGEQTPFN